MTKQNRIPISLDEGQAWLLAQLFKRLTYNDILGCAVDKAECEDMIAIVENAQEQLAQQGISPR